MIPHWLVKQILIGVAKVLPKTKLVPQKEEVKENLYRDLKKRKMVSFHAKLNYIEVKYIKISSFFFKI